MIDEELFHSLALIRVQRLGLVGIRKLLEVCGSATEVFQMKRELPGISPKLLEAMESDDIFESARREMEFIQKNHITCLGFNDPDYPSRLRECDDAPILLFYKGNASLNVRRVINMVGTRRATEYGKELCNQFLHDLKQLCPDVLVVSGLAYGIDIFSHTAALENGFNTVGVLAHGLDRIYPSMHRQTAIEMLKQGGLLTEFTSGIFPDKFNFVQRNRIVAGMCDATIVVESAVRGGALITAEMASGYNRDCFAFPGRCYDTFSQGCNALIRNNRAALIQSAEDFVRLMQWDGPTTVTYPVQRELFPDLTPEEKGIADLLQASPDGLPINELSLASQIPVNKLSALLFEMEMKGVLQALPGNRYRLVRS